jgi:hypothetical protein
MFAAIRRAYAIPNFFDTCARVKAERNVAVSIGSIMPKRMGALCHVEALFEKEQICWIWTPLGFCWGESTPAAKVASVASEPVAQIAKAEEKR